MAAEQVIDYGFDPVNFSAPLRLVETPELDKPQTQLENLILHFDENWKEEGLPRDWYNLREVGFSMNSQMNLLPDLEAESRELWLNQTERDIRGFVVEYLQSGLVHPSYYTKVTENGMTFFKDLHYGKGMVDTVSEEERNGAVRSAVAEIHDSMIESGGIAVVSSPKGWTGLKTDREIPIEYPDTFFHIFIGDGENLASVGIATDFSLEQCNQVIKRLTGRQMPANASVMDYVKAVANIRPDQGVRTPADFVAILQEIKGSDFAHGEQTWNEVYRDLNRLDKISLLREEAEAYIQDLKDFVLYGNRTEFELRKAVAATMLRLSALYIEDKEARLNKPGYRVGENIIYPDNFQTLPGDRMSYGQILDEVERIPGCAGGGKGSAIDSIVERLGVSVFEKLAEDKYGSREVECPSCHSIVIRPKDTLVKNCNHCGSDKISCK